MKKALLALLVLIMALSLTACMSEADKQKAADHLIEKLGGTTYYCHNKPTVGPSATGSFEEDVLSVTFSGDCSRADALWKYQVTSLKNGIATNLGIGDIIETEIPCDVDIKVKRKDVFDLVLKYSFTSEATNKKYGPYEDTLTVRIVDDHIYENGILFDDVDFSILNNDDEGLAFTTVESNIEGLR